MSVRWQHCIDHADKQTEVTRLSSRRSSAADRQSVKRDYLGAGSACRSHRIRLWFLRPMIISKTFLGQPTSKFCKIIRKLYLRTCLNIYTITDVLIEFRLSASETKWLKTTTPTTLCLTRVNTLQIHHSTEPTRMPALLCSFQIIFFLQFSNDTIIKVLHSYGLHQKV